MNNILTFRVKKSSFEEFTIDRELFEKDFKARGLAIDYPGFDFNDNDQLLEVLAIDYVEGGYTFLDDALMGETVDEWDEPAGRNYQSDTDYSIE